MGASQGTGSGWGIQRDTMAEMSLPPPCPKACRISTQCQVSSTHPLCGQAASAFLRLPRSKFPGKRLEGIEGQELIPQ